MTKLYIVDDHQIFRDGLKLLINSTDDLEVIGDAESGALAIKALATVQPDLILMDIQMPGENGIEVTRKIKHLYPEARVLMLTMFEDDHSVFSAMQAGACGYILKGINHVDMLRSLRVAAAGGAIFSPRVAGRMLAYFTTPPIQKRADPAPANSAPVLSQRELQVLALLAEGDDNGTIAEKLTLTRKTVRNYVSQVLKKLEIADRQDAGVRARELGLE